MKKNLDCDYLKSRRLLKEECSPDVHLITEVLGEDVLPLLLRHKGGGVHRSPEIIDKYNNSSPHGFDDTVRVPFADDARRSPYSSLQYITLQRKSD
jgi:hypothetical protein